MNNQRRKPGRGIILFILLVVLFLALIYRANQYPQSEGMTELEQISMVIHSDINRVLKKTEEVNTQVISSPPPATKTTVSPTLGKNQDSVQPGFHYYYKLLDELQQILYEDIAKCIQSQKNTLRYAGTLSENEIFDTIKAVTFDYPEYFWFEGNSKVRSYSGGGFEHKDLLFTYSLENSEIAEKQAQLDLITDQIINNLKSKSEYEKVKGVYDYLIDHTEYDLATGKEQSLLPALIEHRGVCASYAKSFQYLMNLLDVEVLYVSGTATNRFGTENHAWNIVKIDGDYYNVDVTWGDPQSTTGINVKNYAYLNVTTEEIERNHTPDKKWSLPTCIETKYNYYTMEKALFTRYDEIRLCELLADSCKSGDWCRIKAGSQACYDDFLQKMASQRWQNNLASQLLLFGYPVNYMEYCPYDDMLCIDIRLSVS